MEKLSLVGLKATDIVSRVASDGGFYLTHYRQPVALVIAPPSSKRELYVTLERLAQELFDE